MSASIVFYAWGGVSLTSILIVSIIGNCLFGLLINRAKHISKLYLLIGISFNLLLLGTFKYGGFIIENLNIITSRINLKPIDNPGIILPLGISFFTFQALSYLIDVYRNETPVQKNLFHLALFISFFPQLIAGPIVRYNYIAKQLTNRKETIDNFSRGIERFVLGLVKKVVIANQFAIVANEVFNLSPDILPQQMAWAGLICYSFQIYFDFAGYSDMAIGLGRMFGFQLPENFDYPYITGSIRQFWNHWHITLGAWLKNYLYFPLGGNKKGTQRTYLNLLLVFIICGFWHGASWNFFVWGLVHGSFMIFERIWFEEKILKKIGKIIPVFYTFSVATLAWVFFETKDLEHSIAFFKVLFIGNQEFSGGNYLVRMFSPEFFVIATPAVAGSFGFFKKIQRVAEDNLPELKHSLVVNSLKTAFILCALVIITILLISDTYNPFIYFRF
ncbi:MBOAT family O-acyltransferase [Sunxiuqinia sp. A32]|uniref:MBOAT family O-acyltransferase n=1 Tax=Sunxiuqinia sp. A32 TaxID=3461496 RepID=UPI004046452A